MDSGRAGRRCLRKATTIHNKNKWIKKKNHLNGITENETGLYAWFAIRDAAMHFICVRVFALELMQLWKEPCISEHTVYCVCVCLLTCAHARQHTQASKSGSIGSGLILNSFIINKDKCLQVRRLFTRVCDILSF